MSMQSMMMALLGGQAPKRGFKDSIMQTGGAETYNGNPTPLNMHQDELFSGGRGNFFEQPKGGSFNPEDDDEEEDPKMFKIYQEPSYEDEDFTPLHAALDTVNAMRDIRKRGNLGIFSPYSLSPDTRRDAGEYERLGKSLIQQSSNIPIRNKQEFDVLAGDLFDPSITDAKAEGILNGMEKIISDSLRIQESKEKKGSKSKKKSTETKKGEIPKPPITSFFK